ncbi:MAG TPA: trehalose-phosphatase [Trueperaceae bacterium]
MSRPAPPLVEKPLFLLDYDGTLAEIVDDPDEAVPHPRVAEVLGRLADLYPVRVLTGRRVADLAQLLPVPRLVAIGVHGLEEGRLGEGARSRLDDDSLELMTQARERLPRIDGVRIEDKGEAIALHYRQARDEERVLAELRDWSQRLPEGLDLVWGKKVVEVRPGGFDKGRAASEIYARHPGTTPVMIGDDTTDEDAFQALVDAVTVKVGDGDSAARYRLADVDEVVGYLERYLE